MVRARILNRQNFDFRTEYSCVAMNIHSLLLLSPRFLGTRRNAEKKDQSWKPGRLLYYKCAVAAFNCYRQVYSTSLSPLLQWLLSFDEKILQVLSRVKYKLCNARFEKWKHLGRPSSISRSDFPFSII